MSTYPNGKTLKFLKKDQGVSEKDLSVFQKAQGLFSEQ